MTEALPGDGPLQFGGREPGEKRRERPCTHGVAARADGRIAVVCVSGPDAPPYFDLPGGGIDPGEDGPEALVREFGEETGLVVTPGRLLARAGQWSRLDDGEYVNNLEAFYEAAVLREDASLKIEDDHALVWWEPLEAVWRLRLESHAYAVMSWLRATARAD